MDISSPTPKAPFHPTNRWNPRGWNTSKRLTALAAGAFVLTGLWAAFRPEKLFINQTVNESLTVGGSTQLVSEGKFASLAHHTEGTASLYRQKDGYTLRLMDFSTSNGPDVHLYVTEAAGVDNGAIKSGRFLDLGNLKGNIGDQNYMLPAGFDPNRYQGVSIWCKRFAVNFAGADLATGTMPMKRVSANPVTQQMATEPVVVTTGAFRRVTKTTKGSATITEDGSGKRVLTLRDFQTEGGPDLHLYLWKAEDVRENAAAAKLVKQKAYVDLGLIKPGSTQNFSVPKEIDLWQYLAAGVWSEGLKSNFGTAPLASPQ